jgi:hypothetical protein
MSWTRTTTVKGYYRPQQEATVQAASEGKYFGHPLESFLSFVGQKLGGLIFGPWQGKDSKEDWPEWLNKSNSVFVDPVRAQGTK